MAISITPEEFNKTYNRIETWGEGDELVDRLSLEQMKALYDNLKFTQQWVGVTMRDEWLLGILKCLIKVREKHGR